MSVDMCVDMCGPTCAQKFSQATVNRLSKPKKKKKPSEPQKHRRHDEPSTHFQSAHEVTHFEKKKRKEKMGLRGGKLKLSPRRLTKKKTSARWRRGKAKMRAGLSRPFEEGGIPRAEPLASQSRTRCV